MTLKWYWKLLTTSTTAERLRVEKRDLEHQLRQANSLAGALKSERDELYRQVRANVSRG